MEADAEESDLQIQGHFAEGEHLPEQRSHGSRGIKLVGLVDGVCWGRVFFFFLISTQSYEDIKLVEHVDGVCWGRVSSSFLSPLNHIRISSFRHQTEGRSPKNMSGYQVWWPFGSKQISPL
ncbi:hypothetical protein LAZ67_22001112 [Cordylochernes scorpioides]|uniref:Uncharacterized protein n=1 Tax=Cordylochernes scorpioides TaxID=51811 RepID=A0ABY6LRA9_9ARAC|nr:hypothetical protein LAZ67_22001112 [Cordylochernes scorpioides]